MPPAFPGLAVALIVLVSIPTFMAWDHPPSEPTATVPAALLAESARPASVGPSQDVGVAPAVERSISSARDAAAFTEVRDGDLVSGYSFAGGDIRAFLGPGGVDLDFPVSAAEGSPAGGAMRVEFAGARAALPRGLDPAQATFSHFFGSDASRWQTGLRSFGAVEYPSVYPGISVRFRSEGLHLKYEVLVEAGADPSLLAMQFKGATSIEIAPDGSLVIASPSGSLRDAPPVSFQEDGAAVDCLPVALAADTIGFHCGGRDPALDLTIDPLLYSSYFGGSSWEHYGTMTTDASGNIYALGETGSADFPVSPGAPHNNSTNGDLFIAKFSHDGTRLLYSAVIGGSQADDPGGIQVLPSGAIVVAGTTASFDFPVTPGAFNTVRAGNQDAFIVRINASGTSIDFSTLVGGSNSDYGNALVVDAGSRITLTGGTSSSDFPTSAGAPNRTFAGPSGWWDAFIVRISADGSSLIFGTYLGGAAYYEMGSSLAVDATGATFVGGYTHSADFPATSTELGTCPTTIYSSTAFIAKLNPAGTAFSYIQCFGNLFTNGLGALRFGPEGSLYFAGGSDYGIFPQTNGSYGLKAGLRYGGFVGRLNGSALRFDFVTVVGGAAVYDLEVDSNGTIYTAGHYWGYVGAPFATTPGALQSTHDWDDATFVKLSPDASEAYFATYLGGSGQEVAWGVLPYSNGSVLLAGQTSSADFPVTPDARNGTLGGSYDWFFSVFDTKTNTSVRTEPPGLDVWVNGNRVSAPFDFTCHAGDPIVLALDPSQGGPQTRSTFLNWSDGGAANHTAVCGPAANLTANFTAEYLVNLNASLPGALITVDGAEVAPPAAFWWAHGVNHTVEAPGLLSFAWERWAFAGWSDGGPRNHTLAVSGPLDLVANFDPAAYRVTITSSLVGPELVVDGSPVPVPVDTWWDAASVHQLSIADTYTLEPRQFSFTEWSDGGARTHSVTASSPLNLTATFTLSAYLVQVRSDAGDLALIVAGTSVPTPWAAYVAANSSLTLGAEGVVAVSSNERWVFARWSDAGAQNRTLTITAPVNLSANYTHEYRLNLSATAGALGRPESAPLIVTLDGAPLPFPVQVWAAAGSAHTVVAPTPQEMAGRRFTLDLWTPALGPLGTVNMTGPRSFTANFTVQYALVLATDPPGLVVTFEGSDLVGGATLWLSPGSHRTLSIATPQLQGTTRFVFFGWSDGATLAVRPIDIAQPANYTARFETQYAIVIDTLPPGIVLRVDGATYVEPKSVWWKADSTHTLAVDDEVTLDTTTFQFSSWSQGGPASQSYTVTGPAHLVANFAPKPISNAPVGGTGVWWVVLVAAVAASAFAAFLVVRRRKAGGAAPPPAPFEPPAGIAGAPLSAAALSDRPPSRPAIEPPTEVMPCPQCGAPVAIGAAACAACGLAIVWG